MAKKATVYLWTGHGWGKTTSAIGVAVRAIGHGYKVVIVQFMKGWGDKIGEYKIRKKIGPKYQIKQFGREEWVNLENPLPEDREIAKKGLEFAKKAAEKKPFLLILDEINLAVSVGLLELNDVVKLLDEIPPEVIVYMTGRNAPVGLIKRADYVNEINMLKGPKKLEGEKGIDY